MSNLQHEVNRRRTFAIISHPDAGKTTLTEKFLLYGGAINLAGSVKGKATARHAVSDWMEIEKERGISVTSSVLQFEYDGYCINILDTPGYFDFVGEQIEALSAADCAVLVISGKSGVSVGAEKAWAMCAKKGIPMMIFINKLDDEKLKFPAKKQLKNAIKNPEKVVKNLEMSLENLKKSGQNTVNLTDNESL